MRKVNGRGKAALRNLTPAAGPVIPTFSFAAILTASATVGFTIAAIRSFGAGRPSTNPLVTYLTAAASYFFFDWFLWIAVSAVTVLTAYTLTTTRKTDIRQRVFRSILVVSASAILGLLLALPIAYGYAMAHAIAITRQISRDPIGAGIEYRTNTIASAAANMASPPALRRASASFASDIAGLAAARTNGYGRFYVMNLLAEAVTNSPPPLLPDAAGYLYGQTLFVTKADRVFAEQVGPPLAASYITAAFPDLSSTRRPSTETLTPDAYHTIRDQDISARIRDAQALIGKIDAAIGTLTARIAEASATLAEIDRAIPKAQRDRDEDDKRCRAMTYCDNGSCFDYTKTCDDLKGQYDGYIRTLDAQKAEIASLTARANTDIGKLRSQRNILTNNIGVLTTAKENIPFERGVFTPPSRVLVLFDEREGTAAFPSFVATLVHEYLHHVGYRDKKTVLPQFFEEGLTEYFAEVALAGKLPPGMETAYPVPVVFFRTATQRIAERDLLSIYLNKDTAALARVFDTAFGKGFITENTLAFDSLLYASGTDAEAMAKHILDRAAVR